MTGREDNADNVMPIAPVLLVISLGLVMGLIHAFYGAIVATTIGLVIVVWGIDVVAKVALKFGTATAAADLSLSALIFSLGQAIGLIDVELSDFNPTQILSFISIAISLLLPIWIANIILCNRVDQKERKPQPGNERYWILVERCCTYLLAISSAFIIVAKVANFDFDITGYFFLGLCNSMF